MKIITSTFYQNIKFSIKKLHSVSLNLSSRYMRFIELSIDLLTFIALVIHHNILILHNSYIAKQLLNSWSLKWYLQEARNLVGGVFCSWLYAYSQLQKTGVTVKQSFILIGFNYLLLCGESSNPSYNEMWSWKLALVLYMVVLSDFHYLLL